MSEEVAKELKADGVCKLVLSNNTEVYTVGTFDEIMNELIVKPDKCSSNDLQGKMPNQNLLPDQLLQLISDLTQEINEIRESYKKGTEKES